MGPSISFVMQSRLFDEEVFRLDNNGCNLFWTSLSQISLQKLDILCDADY